MTNVDRDARIGGGGEDLGMDRAAAKLAGEEGLVG